MPDYHYLGSKGFPHADNVDVYQYDNQMDYSRYDYSQMQVQVCSVPWEQGEAHVGQRTLSGIGNVVYFGNADERNKWFENIPDTDCFRWETRFKELHSDLTLRVPLPFDVASEYNYVVVSYNLFANNESPVQYESDDGMRKWFYFIRESRFISPNTTELILLDDAWQTWIYNLDITSMILERGHAPLFATDADTYLADPIGNCGNLLAEDVNFGTLQKVTDTQATPLNAEDVYAVIITSADPESSDWGRKDDDSWRTPARAHYDVSGVPNMYAMAVRPTELGHFLTEATRTWTQFKQTVQCIFFCEGRLLAFGKSFAFAETTCYEVTGSESYTAEIFSRTKDDWHYPAQYADLAKLYTYPYSVLEITDEKGNVEQVRIEDTANVLTMQVNANIVFPYINLQGVVQGIGGSGSSTVSFRNLTESDMAFTGTWYDHLREWDIPTFAVVLSANREYDYSTHYDRVQANNDRATNRTNSENIANASYTATSTTANASYTAASTTARAAETVADNNASNTVDNASAQTSANTTVTARGNSAALADARLSNALAQAIQAWEAGLTRATTNNEVDAANATASVGAAGGVINSAAGGAISGAMGGPIGAAIGALTGLVSGGISAATSLATNAIAVNAKTSQAEAVVSNSQSKLEETQQSNLDRTNRANTGRTQQKNAQNTAITTSAANTASTMRENADTTRAASISAADTVRDASISAADTVRDASVNAAELTYTNEGRRISNGFAQGRLRAPFIYGRIDNASTATTKPMALFVNIVTESDYAIAQAGDEFLRFGYRLDRQWDFDGDWCIGKHFTYWQLRDYWSNTQIPDRYSDQIRFLLTGGVTVWSKPEDIGKVTIYDNQ